jgi:hypothetical protein
MGSEPQLLDVVPWTYGFAHTWAVRWLIDHHDTRGWMLNLLTGRDDSRWDLMELVAYEHRVNGARADLAAWALGADGEKVQLAVETKVNDPISKSQLAAYSSAGFTPVLYLPGLTGLLYGPNGPVAGERWVNGLDLARALKTAKLPQIISSYVDAVREEGKRMELARAFCRDEVDDFPAAGQAPYNDVMDAAWIAEVALSLRRHGAQDIIVRPQSNDRGLWWKGSERTLKGGAEIYIDVVADLRTHFCSVALKVKGGDPGARLAAYDEVRAAGPPSPQGWKPGRRPSRQSGRVWSLDASELNADEAAQLAIGAGVFIDRVARGAA